ncbi:MAG: metal-dependent phosphohydrolase, partial [Treponema sp.]|nr:metal-dependent phosphohydrolase [Treponema sp.]
ALRLADDEAKKFTQELVNSTHEMVKSSAQLISENIFSNELMNILVEKSNGTIVQHMTRVYLNGISFLSYYNNLVSTSSAIQKMRIAFAAKYRNFYHKLLPHMGSDDIILERIFYGGMRAVPPDLYFKWAVGFLIHDIGKAGAVEYHEGEEKYNRNIVIDHVKQGYKSIMNKTNYPMEASLITGYHHEYYGDPAGYGYFRAYLEQYKKANPSAKQDYCITYDLEPILDYRALAYFPAKVLEIIDVYDSVTDPHRIYRKTMTPDEALTMMREEFVEKHQKIDVILFDIFSMYVNDKEKQKVAA